MFISEFADQMSDKTTKPPHNPWPWRHSKKNTVALLRSPQGQHWIRVTHHSGQNMLVPWPVFFGWERALPPECGSPDHGIQAYAVADTVAALKSLREKGFSTPLVLHWREMLAKLAQP
jgi:hypothetical protein